MRRLGRHLSRVLWLALLLTGSVVIVRAQAPRLTCSLGTHVLSMERAAWFRADIGIAAMRSSHGSKNRHSCGTHD